MALFSAEDWEPFWGLFRRYENHFERFLFAIIPGNTSILLKVLF